MHRTEVTNMPKHYTNCHKSFPLTQNIPKDGTDHINELKTELLHVNNEHK